jgi:hypothetical protein
LIIIVLSSMKNSHFASQRLVGAGSDFVCPNLASVFFSPSTSLHLLRKFRSFALDSFLREAFSLYSPGPQSERLLLVDLPSHPPF